MDIKLCRHINKTLAYLFISWNFVLQQGVVAQDQLQIDSSDEINFSFDEFYLPGGQKENHINSITQGPYGFMWFGSQAGLHRYDGHEIVTYKSIPGDTNSLSYDYVETLLWDRSQSLWISTYGGGLFCFDPETETFKPYQHNPEDQTSLSNDQIKCSIEDAAGNLWFGTNYGLNRFDPKQQKFERYFSIPEQQNSLSHNVISNLYIDANEELWVATGSYPWNPEKGGLCRYLKASNSFECFVNDPEDENSIWTSSCRSLLEDSQGNFWVGTAKGLQKMDREAKSFERMLPNPNQPFAPGTGQDDAPNIFSLMEDRNGGIWVGSWGLGEYPVHLLRYNPNTQKSRVFPSPENCWRLFEAADGNIWMCPKLTQIRPNSSSPDFQKPNPFLAAFENSSFGQKDAESFFFPHDFCVDQQNQTLWSTYSYRPIGRHQFYIGKHDLSNGKTQLFALKDVFLDAFPMPEIEEFGSHGLGLDRQGRVWGSAPKGKAGIFCYDPIKDSTFQLLHDPHDPQSLSSNFITSVCVDKNDGVWATTFEHGLNHLQANQTQISRIKSREIGGLFPNAVLEDTKGTIWVGGDQGRNDSFTRSNSPFLAKRINGQINWDPIKFPETVKGEIRCLTESPQGHILFTLSDHGFGAWDPQEKNFRFFNTETQSFPIDHIASLVFDEAGILWVASSQDGRFVRFAYPDGDQHIWKSKSNEPARIGDGLLGSNGRLYFLNERRWSEINPTAESLQPQKASDKVSLVSLYVQEEVQHISSSPYLSKPLWLSQAIQLPHTAESFGFRFTDFDYSPNNQLDKSGSKEFLYRLLPYQQNWQKTNGVPIANYFKVTPGSYRFQVKPYRETGQVREEIVEVLVIITPPWWKTNWAYILYTMAVLSLLYFIYQYNLRRQIALERKRQKQKLEELKSHFFTNITHEFRTPLTVILGLNEDLENKHEALLLSTEEGNRFKRGHQLIQRSGNNLLRLINQLLDLSKLDFGAMKLEKIQADIIPFLRYLTESFHSIAIEKKIVFTFQSSIERLVMDFDETKLQHIVYNLLSNAFKFTPEKGKISVWISEWEEKGKPYIQIAVKDTGIGIAPENLEAIFDRFYQSESPHKRTGEGSGIGLAFSKEMAELMGGKIEVQSTQGEGSNFRLCLPIQNSSPLVTHEGTTALGSLNQSPHLPHAIAPISQIGRDERPLLLIIEDNEGIISYLRSVLQDQYNLEIAQDGKAGLEEAKRLVPDIIITDVMMPKLDGYQLCKTLKSDESTSHIPIIMLTAKATEQARLEGLKVGADAYLPKPFNKAELFVRLEKLVALRRALQERYSRISPSGQQSEFASQLEPVSPSLDDLFMQKVRQLIEDNISDPALDIAHICEAVHLSTTQLFRKMKALTGNTPMSYVRKVRLHKAKELLLKTKLGVSVIAYDLGFSDPHYFSRAFKKEFGQSPSQVRKEESG